MLHKKIFNVLNNCYNCKLISLRYSALFINGPKASETFVYVTPHVDYTNTIKKKDLIKQQVDTRKISIDLNKLEHLWNVYEELMKRKTDFEKHKEEIARELGKLTKSEQESDQLNKYKIQLELLKDNIKKLRVPLWSAEEAAIHEYLKLPNLLDSKTPENANQVIFSYLTRPQNDKDHLSVGKKYDLIHFNNNGNYYLKGDAAVFELGAKFYFNNVLRRNKFIQFSNPDFVKSVIVEGSGENHRDPDCSYILHHNEDSKVNIDNRLHLTGGGSLSSFLAYHTKNVLHSKALPLKYFSMGRQYVPSLSNNNSLFHVSQSSVVQIFGATKDATALNEVLDELIEILKQCYTPLGCHFRLAFASAEKLTMWEALRVVVEMYSTALDAYIEVANVSLSGDYISKRLMLTYMDNKQSKFPHIVSGTILNVPKLLGCFLERNNTFSLPEEFQVENWN